MNLPIHASHAPLTGAALHDFLDEAESALAQQEETGVGDELRQSTLAALLARQACLADDMESVSRLHRLWLQAGRADHALRVLQADGATAVDALPDEAQAQAHVQLLFWRIEVMLASGAGTPARQPALAQSLEQALEQGERTLQAQPGAGGASVDDWAQLADLSAQAGDQARARRCFEALHLLNTSSPERSTYRAWDASMLNARLAASHHAEGQADQAQACALAAVQALATAEPGQDVDSDDWVHLGERLLCLAPALIDDIARHAQARMPADAAAALHRQLAVRVARLRARALHARGLLDQALDVAPAGRFSLTCGEDDAFSAAMLDWLIEAERWPEAARLAFALAYYQYDVSGLHACRQAIAHEDRATEDDATRAHWLLARACMSYYDELWQDDGPDDLAAHWESHLAAAEQWMPGHAVIRLLRGLYMVRIKSDPAQSLRWLESVTELPALASGNTLHSLYLQRMRVHGVRKALALPFVKSLAGSWNYAIGVYLGDLHESLPEGTEWPQQEVDALQIRYYEQGLACFEAFFATGEGHYRSGDVHDYAMLCNNLAIGYRYRGDPQLALPLHAKGIAASPFAEHYHGIVCCHRALNNHEALVDAAEQLWHYARTYGYGRHRPDQYFDDVTQALWHLSRCSESAIWRQRLQEWWDGLDEHDQREYAESHLGTLVMLLSDMCIDQADDSLPELEALLPRIRACEWTSTHSNAALAFKRAGRYQMAIDLYKEVLARCGGPSDRDAQWRRQTKDSLSECRKALRAQHPWWKFWG